MRLSSSLSRGGRPAGAGQEGVCVGFGPPAVGPDAPGLMSMGGPMAVLVRGCVGVVVSILLLLVVLVLFCGCFGGPSCLF